MTTQSVSPWTFRIPESAETDLAEFSSIVGRFKSGEASEAQFRAFRVPMGVYEQRESGTYMLRVRFPPATKTAWTDSPFMLAAGWAEKAA